MKTIHFIISDQVWYLAFQALLALLTAWAVIRINILTESSPISGVTRGEKSRGFMAKAAPLLLTVIVSVITTVSTYPTDGKVFYYLLNVAEIVYLTMWNGWSTNKLIGFMAAFEQRNFNPHH